MPPTSIRALIVDDEPLARERLRQLLESAAQIEVCGECGDGLSAVEAIQRDRPDLVFLDIQMPELDGFGVVAALPPAQLPAIIFITAYDEFAVKAFEVHALDYLLKPIDRQRLHQSIERAVRSIRQPKASPETDKLLALLNDIRPPKSRLDRLPVKTEGRVIFLNPADIDWIEAADNYVELHVGKESILHREKLTALESKLDPARFYRISRSVIVNAERIKEMQPLFHGDYSVILRDGTRLTLSRSHRDTLNRLLGKGE